MYDLCDPKVASPTLSPHLNELLKIFNLSLMNSSISIPGNHSDALVKLGTQVKRNDWHHIALPAWAALQFSWKYRKWAFCMTSKIRMLPKRWAKVVANDRQYFEWNIFYHFFTTRPRNLKKNGRFPVVDLISFRTSFLHPCGEA